MKTNGFTILELLLVIVIIFILVAILFPVFMPTHHHRRDRAASCASNEKQLGLGLLQYVQDNDEMMPDVAQSPGSPVTWRRLIHDYVKSTGIYQCPDRHDFAPGPDGFSRSYGANFSGNNTGGPFDKGNGAFAGPGSKPVSIAETKNPAALISLCEVAGSNRPEFNIDDVVHFCPQAHLLWAAHSGRGNYVFMDGHVKRLQPLGTQTFWYRDPARPLSADGLAVLTETEARAMRTRHP